ncbi:MAG TPA: ankyrin repeat domain-containing protein, partial [Spirochaetota bacterium]|nr:ankyrin repeat domain-containing protein [Spirochaetota bacterium]
MKRIFYIFFLIVTVCSFVNSVHASVLDELRHIDSNYTFLLYSNIQQVRQYMVKKGLPASDFPFLIGEKTGQDFENGMKKFNIRLQDIREMLVAINVDTIKEKEQGLFIMDVGPGKGTIPKQLLQEEITTSAGTIYSLMHNDKKLCIMKSRNYFVMGTLKSVKSYAGNVSRPSGRATHRSFRDSCRGKCVYGNLVVTEFLKKEMGGAVQSGARHGKGLDANVFLKSILTLHSVEAGMQLGKRISFHGGLRSSSRKEGERLMMVSHFLIVGSSIAISFVDTLSRSFGRREGATRAADEKNMGMIQEMFGRIGTKQVDNGVVLSFQFTSKETDIFVAHAKEKIAREKERRAERLEMEAVCFLTDAIREGNRTKMLSLLKQRVDINGADNNGYTPLSVAAEKGDIETVRILLHKGAKVNVSGFSLKAPLHAAAEGGSVEIVTLLLQKGANPNLKG